MPVYLPPLSRRRFLGNSFCAAAAVATGCAMPGRQDDFHNVALLSDTHIAADPGKIELGVNMANHLHTAVDEVLAWPQKPRTVFVNGDLAFNSGSPAEYSAFTELLRPIRRAGVPIYLGLGNHDNRENFWSTLPGSKSAPAPIPKRQALIVRTPLANWFLLDSLIQTLTIPGRLGDEQRAWLAKALDANADKPAIILIHHQPYGPLPGKKPSGLEDVEPLFAILRPRLQVKAYFFGHTHRWGVQQDKSGIHLINLPPTSYVFQPGYPMGWVHVEVQSDRAQIELRSLDRTHPSHGQKNTLVWRTA